MRTPRFRIAALFGPALAFLVWGACPAMAQTEKEAESETAEGWIALFNGKDLKGWTPKIRYEEVGKDSRKTFRVEDGAIKVSYENYDKFNENFGHLFYETEFSHYRLRVEYRFTGEQLEDGPGWAIRNSGIMLHGQRPETMAVDQDFPVSLEAQLLGGNGTDPRTTANLCTPGTHVEMDGKLITQHCISSKSKTYHGDQWVTVEVEVRGGEIIKHVIDGETVIRYRNPILDASDETAKPLIEARDGELGITKGTISLQSESHPVEFRKVELLRLEGDGE